MYDPLERADFSKVAEIFQQELSSLEIDHYNNLSVTEEKRLKKKDILITCSAKIVYNVNKKCITHTNINHYMYL